MWGGLVQSVDGIKSKGCDFRRRNSVSGLQHRNVPDFPNYCPVDFKLKTET